MDSASPPDQLAIFAAVGVAFVFTLIWIPVTAFTAVAYSRATAGGVKADPAVFRAWLISLAAGFTGPCVGPIALGFIAWAVFSLRRRPDANPATRAAARATIAHSSVLVTMYALMLALFGLGGLLSA